LQNIETKKICELPKEYREFLLAYNGGKPYWNCFEMANYFLDGRSDFDSVRFFYSICLDSNAVTKNYDIFEMMRVHQNRIPDELLTIATDSLGNEICLCVKGEKYGKIFFWDHEEESPRGQEPWWDNIYLIANNFTGFINGLCKFDEDDQGNEIRRFQDGTVKINGHPDCIPHAKISIEIKKLTCTREKDIRMANKVSGLQETPDDWTWHHVEDGKTMQLIPYALHKGVEHTGEQQ
jgi:SMI1 / KNR4 family (SUKH-1)/A nuclease of the HNH/ENDO VII superfamily with conserved WHH